MSIVFVSASSQRLDNTSTGIVTDYPFTLYGWFKFTGSKPTTGYPHFLGPNQDFDTFATMAYVGQFVTDVLWARVEDGSGDGSTVTMAGIAADTWFNGVAVFASATSRTIYANGSGGTTNTTSVAFPTLSRFHVGARWNSGTYTGYLDGECADIGIVPAAATSGEIADYASGISGQVVWPAGGFGGRNGERVHWDLLTNSDLTDVINSIVLTAQGSPTSGTHPSLSYGGGADNEITAAFTLGAATSIATVKGRAGITSARTLGTLTSAATLGGPRTITSAKTLGQLGSSASLLNINPSQANNTLGQLTSAATVKAVGSISSTPTLGALTSVAGINVNTVSASQTLGALTSAAAAKGIASASSAKTLGQLVAAAFIAPNSIITGSPTLDAMVSQAVIAHGHVMRPTWTRKPSHSATWTRRA